MKGSSLRLNRPVCGLKEEGGALRHEMNEVQRASGAMRPGTREDECPYERASEQLKCRWYSGDR